MESRKSVVQASQLSRNLSPCTEIGQTPVYLSQVDRELPEGRKIISSSLSHSVEYTTDAQ